MGGSNKNYLNLKLLVFIPEVEILELNSLYPLSLMQRKNMCNSIKEKYTMKIRGLLMKKINKTSSSPLFKKLSIEVYATSKNDHI